MRRITAAVLLFVLITAIIVTRKPGYRESVAAKYTNIADNGLMLIIDAGHGGLDGGAVGVDGTKESAINLEIAEKLYSVARFLGCRCVMTRESEKLNYPYELDSISKKKVWDQKTRVELINSYNNACLISIHQNKYPDSRPNGSQVLYSGNAQSEEFGTCAHNNLTRQLCPENRRVPARISDKIYLMRNVRCPAILAECGFVSNSEELAKLKSVDYQKKIAVVLAASYLQSFGYGGTNEGQEQVLLY